MALRYPSKLGHEDEGVDGGEDLWCLAAAARQQRDRRGGAMASLAGGRQDPDPHGATHPGRAAPHSIGLLQSSQ
eukprot:1853759-Prymnesium_polylepis.2